MTGKNVLTDIVSRLSHSGFLLPLILTVSRRCDRETERTRGRQCWDKSQRQGVCGGDSRGLSFSELLRFTNTS